MPSCDSKRYKRSEKNKKKQKKKKTERRKRNYLSLARLGPHLLGGGRSHGNTHTQVNQLDVYMHRAEKGVCWKCTVKKGESEKTMRSRSRSRSTSCELAVARVSMFCVTLTLQKSLTIANFFPSFLFLLFFFSFSRLSYSPCVPQSWRSSRFLFLFCSLSFLSLSLSLSLSLNDA